MDKKQLSPIHRELIQFRNLFLQEAVNLVKQREREFKGSLELIAKELGADFVKETWTVSDDGMFLECVERS